jgi:hypothetical protein
MSVAMRDAELSLAIAACNASFVDGLEPALEALARTVNWDRFVRITTRHRVQALCWHGIEPIRELIPATAEKELRLQATGIVESNLRIAAESARLLALFKSANVPLMFLKGLTLGALAYRDPFLKMGWDIDLLIAREELQDAALLLRSNGYLPTIPNSDGAPLQRWHDRRKESAWHNAQHGFHVDLHTRLADHPAMLSDVNIDSPSQIVHVAEGIELPTLAGDELFAYLTVHGASSAWFRLKWITDLAALLHCESSDEIERLYERSQQLGAGRAAGQALLLGQKLYAINIGERLQARLDRDLVGKWLAELAERQIGRISEPTSRPLGTAAIHLSQMLLLPGWRFKRSEAIRQLSDLTRRLAK